MSKRKAWNMAMASAGHAPLQPVSSRQSSRQTVQSRTNRVIDEETRRQVQNSRLVKLEANNFGKTEKIRADEEYVVDDSESICCSACRGKPPALTKTKKGVKQASWCGRKFDSFNQVLMDSSILESEYFRDPSGTEEYDSEYRTKKRMTAPKPTTYVAIAAAPSKKPARHFCNTCGYFGIYTCTQCGSRFCCLKCQEMHKETQCLKFPA